MTHLQGKVRIGPSEWVRAFLGLAVLMSVSTCYVQGHMGDLVRDMRRTTGKVEKYAMSQASIQIWGGGGSTTAVKEVDANDTPVFP